MGNSDYAGCRADFGGGTDTKCPMEGTPRFAPEISARLVQRAIDERKVARIIRQACFGGI
ncbi:hypothetical protein SAMN05216428_1285 [Nitrosospira sp. Nsp11]|uniref:hypothetical protein n=1 Tax=Nitrosospira sp. Nsp11 TaxID=1855338 RepID=UPI0009199C48|nr:hypothetical protein [Nitrosospira sp. Nsp11]SHM32595.1 hypothetical protein SAMN05216428_1285 [Nitrosospira sp. Nsp11]